MPANVRRASSVSEIFTVITHPGGDDDVERAGLYVLERHNSLQGALRLVELLRAEFHKLDTLPDGHRKVVGEFVRQPYVRPWRDYLIYHEMYEQENVVRVLYVWHARRSSRPNFGRQHDPLPEALP